MVQGSAPMIIRGNTITGLYTNCGGISFLPVVQFRMRSLKTILSNTTDTELQ
ncbi:MAG: hypothetical protein R3A12_14680 [Ignavibacteria bacterium]